MEIVLALGVIAFAFTAIIGLLGVATQGTKGADMDARLAALTRRVSSTYQSQPFSTLISGTNVISGTNWYDYNGTPTVSAAAPETYFQCSVTNSGPILSGSNGRWLQIQIRWPYPKLTETNISVISILNYR